MQKQNMINCYAMYDRKGERYDTPFYCRDDLSAKRHFIMVQRNPETLPYQFPDDFDLYRIGGFDYVSGISIEGLTLIMEGKQVAKEERIDEK